MNEPTGATPTVGRNLLRPVDTARPAEMVLTERERQVINDLRRIDFWRAGKSRIATVFWNGVRAAIFDGQQIT